MHLAAPAAAFRPFLDARVGIEAADVGEVILPASIQPYQPRQPMPGSTLTSDAVAVRIRAQDWPAADLPPRGTRLTVNGKTLFVLQASRIGDMVHLVAADSVTAGY